jgi:hypothetical protein
MNLVRHIGGGYLEETPTRASSEIAPSPKQENSASMLSKLFIS